MPEGVHLRHVRADWSWRIGFRHLNVRLLLVSPGYKGSAEVIQTLDILSLRLAVTGYQRGIAASPGAAMGLRRAPLNYAAATHRGTGGDHLK